LHGWTIRWALANGIARQMAFLDGGKPAGLMVKAAHAKDLNPCERVVGWEMGAPVKWFAEVKWWDLKTCSCKRA